MPIWDGTGDNIQPYSIITLCTKNYRQAYNFVIDSWLRTKAERVYVYTDDSEWRSNNECVEIVHYFRPSDDWLLNVGKKVFCCIDAIKRESIDTDNFIFLDIDCYVMREIGSLFDYGYDFDIAATRVDEPKLDTSTGFFCFRNNTKTKNFFLQWQAGQETVKKNRRGVKEGCGAYEQIAFSELLRKSRVNGDLTVLSLNADWCNRKTRLALIRHEALKDSRLKVLHFYQKSFRDAACIAEVNKTLDLETGRLK